MTGIIVNKELAPDVHSICDLFDPKYKGKVEMLNELRDTVPLVMKCEGVEAEKATEADWLKATEGCILWSDNMVIPVGAPNLTAAEAWINSTYDPKNEARLISFDRNLKEAVKDLGATPLATFRLVTLPLIMPGVFGGAMLAFALSIDGFVISNLTRRRRDLPALHLRCRPARDPGRGQRDHDDPLLRHRRRDGRHHLAAAPRRKDGLGAPRPGEPVPIAVTGGKASRPTGRPSLRTSANFETRADPRTTRIGARRGSAD
jgi:hypothetical protein